MAAATNTILPNTHRSPPSLLWPISHYPAAKDLAQRGPQDSELQLQPMPVLRVSVEHFEYHLPTSVGSS